MKLLITSDTHGEEIPLHELITQQADQIQMVLHMGDCAEDLLVLQPEFPQLTLVAVDGNVDYGDTPEKCLTLKGRKIFMTHGHMQGVKMGLSSLINHAKQQKCDVCLFGHTHFQEMFTHDDILFMNPGSLVEPRGGSRAGYGMIEITDDGKISGEVFPA